MQVKHQLKAVVPHNVEWGSQADAVFTALAGDFMVDVVPVVDELLAAGDQKNQKFVKVGAPGLGRPQRLAVPHACHQDIAAFILNASTPERKRRKCRK